MAEEIVPNGVIPSHGTEDQLKGEEITKDSLGQDVATVGNDESHVAEPIYTNVIKLDKTKSSDEKETSQENTNEDLTKTEDIESSTSAEQDNKENQHVNDAQSVDDEEKEQDTPSAVSNESSSSTLTAENPDSPSEEPNPKESQTQATEESDRSEENPQDSLPTESTQPNEEQEKDDPVADGNQSDSDDNEDQSGSNIRPAFKKAGRKPGLEIWRIENSEPVKQDPHTHGNFYTEDAYVLLNTLETTDPRWDIHFWIGKKCSQIDAGLAAAIAVELDESLNGVPVQHREVQRHESKKFLSYFKSGISYLDGGVKSAEVKPGRYIKRLFRCKGKRTVRVEQVEFRCGSLNQGDVFILDDGPNIYVWIGPKSNRIERMKGMEVARNIRDREKSGKALIHTVDDDWETNVDFFKALGPKDKFIKIADPRDNDDEEAIRKVDQEILLYRVFQIDGKMAHLEVPARPISRTMLESDACYMLESGMSSVYCWQGKDTSTDFRMKVWNNVNYFLDDRGYPYWVNVTKVSEGGETVLFKQYFSDWDDFEDQVPQSSEEASSNSEQRPPTTATFMPDDGSGKTKVWRVENGQLSSVPEHAYGVFFGGDSYVILYTYEENEKEKHIIYFWQGLTCTNDERMASVVQSRTLVENLGGEALQIRVTLGKEPAHFLKIFKGRMTVFRVGRVSGFRNLKDHDHYDPDEILMFHVKGNSADQTVANQIEPRASSLNGSSVFLVESDKRVFIWVGKYSTDSDLESAKQFKEYLCPEKSGPTIINQGEETQVFWLALGGKEPYNSGPIKASTLRISPRLFHCSNASGKFLVEEVYNFSQEDLDEDDVMILDTYDEMLVWVGKGANAFERKESFRTAYNYLKADPSARNEENTIIVVVQQGFEPALFTYHFTPWDPEKWNSGRTYKDFAQQISQENEGISLISEEVKSAQKFFSYEELKRKYPPEGVDVRDKERFLSDEDFLDVFHMTKEEYYQKPEWRRINLKKSVSLF